MRRLSGVAPVLSREIWLLVHRDMRAPARVAAVVAWLDSLLPSRTGRL